MKRGWIWITGLAGLLAVLVVAALAWPGAVRPLVEGGTWVAGGEPAVGTLCPAASAEPVREPIRVSLVPGPAFTVGRVSRKGWQRPGVSDPTWLMKFRGLMWLPGLARRAAQDGQTEALAALVRQVVAFHKLNPDPNSNENGWDEGTSMRRLEAENCLYALTRSAALVPAMTADVGVLTSDRYYGPPYRAVHNHGLMANIQMIEAGQLLDRPEWTKEAVERIVAEAPRAFSAQGVSFEQSSFYQLANLLLWERAAAAMESLDGYRAAAQRIRETVVEARRAFRFMTEPDGSIVQIGDSDLTKGQPGQAGDDLVLRDDETGWLIGRSSWTDPKAVYYTVRYGPERRAHGQENRAGGVTWSALATRVLVGTGRYSYDTDSDLSTYRRAVESQNVAAPTEARITGGSTSTITGSFDTAEHRITVTDDVYGEPHSRGITVEQEKARLVVTDSFDELPIWQQNWHLDPAWTLRTGTQGGHKLTFEHPSGRRLTVETTGRVTSIRRGDDAGPYGWVFPRFHSRVPAYQLAIEAAGGGPITTEFSVSGQVS